MIINPVSFTNSYHETMTSASKQQSPKVNGQSARKSKRDQKSVITTVVKDSVNQIVGDQWYPNMEIATNPQPKKWKIQCSPSIKSPSVGRLSAKIEAINVNDDGKAPRF